MFCKTYPPFIDLGFSEVAENIPKLKKEILHYKTLNNEDYWTPLRARPVHRMFMIADEEAMYKARKAYTGEGKQFN